jgi:predicted ester cyclase
MTAEQNKLLVRRLIEEAVTPGDPDVLDEVAKGEFAQTARRWVGPFRASFPDFMMEIVDLVADSEKVAAHFRCSGTHLGEWMGHPPTGRRFQDVDEIYIFRVADGKLAAAFGGGGQPEADAPARPQHVSAARSGLPADRGQMPRQPGRR